MSDGKPGGHGFPKLDTQHSQRLLSPLVESTFLGVCVHRDFKPLYVNDTYAQFLGFANAEDLLGVETLLDFFPQQDRTAARAHYEDLIRHAGDKGVDSANLTATLARVPAVGKDGASLWLDLIDLAIEWQDGLAVYVMVKDVTWQVRAERAEADLANALRREEAQFDDVLKIIPSGVAMYDPTGKLLRYNEAWRELWNLPKDLVDKSPNIRELIEFRAARGDYGETLVSERVETVMGYWQTDGEISFESTEAHGRRTIHIYGLRQPDGNIVLTYMDITERKRMEDALRHEALTDPLTGAPNRRQFEADAARIASAACRYKRPMTVMMVDIDHFKRINDAHGHAVGDEALVSVANEIKRQLRQSDVYGRVGGEEFGACLPETGAQDAMIVAERLRRGVAALRLSAAADPMSLTVSIGVATWTDGPCDMERLIEAADRALYDAKTNGRNRVCAT